MGLCVSSTESHLPIPMTLVGRLVQVTAGNRKGLFTFQMLTW